MIQGSPEAERRNSDPFPFDASRLDALVISHAHIAHIGRVPLLVKRGFDGPIHAQQATAELMPVMLLDAASIAQNEAERANRHRHAREEVVQPLYARGRGWRWTSEVGGRGPRSARPTAAARGSFGISNGHAGHRRFLLEHLRRAQPGDRK
ncbi:MBL fold metallo-hydrolase [Lysobacter niabensis]